MPAASHTWMSEATIQPVQPIVALVRLLASVPPLALAAAGSPRDRAAARAGHALEHPIPPAPPRDRDPRCAARAQAVLSLSGRQAGRRDGTGIGPVPGQSSRSCGGRGHRQLAPMAHTRFGAPSQCRSRGQHCHGTRQRHPRGGSQAHPRVSRHPPLTHRKAHCWTAAYPRNVLPVNRYRHATSRNSKSGSPSLPPSLRVKRSDMRLTHMPNSGRCAPV